MAISKSGTKQYKILVNTGKAETNQSVDVAQGAGERGQPVRIKAQAGAKYQLQEIDKAKSAAPEYVKVRRVGKDLHITFEDDTSTDVIIEDYYSVMPEGYNGVIGKAENGAFYEYVPEDPTAKSLIPELAEGGQAVNVALGGQEVAGVGAAVAVFALTPLLGALGLAGAAAAVAATGAGGAAVSGITGALAAASDTGSSNSDGITSNTSPSFNGKVPAGATAVVSIGGKDYPVTVNPDGTYNYTIPDKLADGIYNPVITVTQNGATTISNGKPFTIDTTAPTVVITSNQSSLTIGQTATITFTLSEASTDFSASDVQVTGGTLTNFSGSGTTYTATFTPTANSTAPGTISVGSGKFQDAAGIVNTDGLEFDNNLSIPTNTNINGATGGLATSSDSGVLGDNKTNKPSPGFSGKATPGSAVDVLINGQHYTTTADANGNYSIPAIKNLPDGTYTPVITVTPTGGTPSVLNGTPLTIDTTLPTITVNADKKSLTNGQTSQISFTLSEDATDFDASDVAVSGGALSNFTKVDASHYSATFTPATGSTANGVISVASARFNDAAGNTNNDGAEANNTATLSVNTTSLDTTKPTVTISADKSALAVGQTALLTFTLSETVGAANEFTGSDVSVTGGTLTNFKQSATNPLVYTATFTPNTTTTSNATGSVTVAADKFVDTSNNLNTAGNTVDFAITLPNTNSATGGIAPTSDTGVVGDNLTTNSTPDFQGTAPAGSAVSVVINNVTYTVTADASGKYNFHVPNSLADGTYTPAITVTPLGGTPSTVNGAPFKIDTTTTVAISSPGQGGTTNSISGTSEPGDLIVIKDASGKELGSTTANSAGQWSFTPSSPVASGPIQAIATDTAGNSASANGTNLATSLNTKATIAISSISDDTGPGANDFVTKDTSLTYSGTVSGFTANGDKVKVELIGTTGTVFTAYVDVTNVSNGNGTWTLDKSTISATNPELASGKYTIRATIVDVPGNQVNTNAGGQATQTLIVDNSAVTNPDNGSNGGGGTDTNASATATITTIHDTANGSVDSGEDSSDFVTNDSTLIVKGTVAGFTSTGATKGDQLLVTILNGSTVVATQYVMPDSAGNWVMNNQANALADGTYTINVDIVDLAGNPVKAAAATHSLVIDTNKGGFDGSSNPGNNNGSDGSGTDANATNATVGVTSISDDTGFSTTDYITSDRSLLINGNTANFSNTGGSAGDKVRVQIVDSAGKVLAEKYVTPGSNGTWTADATGTSLPDGSYTIKSAIVDKAGNTVKAGTDQPLVISNTAAPTSATVSIASISDDTGYDATDFITKDNTLTINGATNGYNASTNKVLVQVLSGTTIVASGYASVDSAGKWSFLPSTAGNSVTAASLANGSYTIRAVLTNTAGNEVTNTAATHALVVDNSGSTNPGNGSGGSNPTDPNSASTVSVSVTTIHDVANGSVDSGSSSTDFITNDNSLVIKGSTVGFSATGAAALDKVRVQILDSTNQVVAVQYVTPDSSGNWSIDNKANALPDGKYTIQADIVDAADNLVKAGAPQALVIDTNKGGTDSSSNPGNGSGTDANTTVAINTVTIHDSANGSIDSGYSSTDFITSDSTLIIKGTVGSGFSNTGTSLGDKVRVQILDSNNQVVAEKYIDPTAGAWSFDNKTNTLIDGNYTIKAAIVDAADNVVKAAADQPLVINSGTTPTTATLAISGIDDGNIATTNATGSKDSGTSATDFVTNDNTLTITGTTAGFNTSGTDKILVQVLDGTTVVTSGYATVGTNTWSYAPARLVDGNYTIRAVYTNNAGMEISTPVNHSLVVDNSAPTFATTTTDVATAQNENIATTMVVYTANATDAGGGAVSYTLSGTDAGAFNINASTGEVTFKASPNYESITSYSFSVVATDLAGNSTTKPVTLAINNVDEVAPGFTSATTATAIAENTAANTAVYTAAATDTDFNSPATATSVTYSLKPSTGDAADFSIDGTTGVVKLIGSPNFETKPSYSFTVVATDAAGKFSEQAVTLAVTNVNEAVTGVNDTASIGEAGGTANGSAGAALASTTSGVNALNVLTNDTDLDNGDTKVVSAILKGTGTGTATAVSASTTSANGQSIVGDYGTLVIGADGSYTYTVKQDNATVQALNTNSTALSDVFTYTVKDAGGLTSTATITVAVNGANDAPIVANALIDTTATQGTPMTAYQFSSIAFTDVDNATLNYTATLADGSALSTKGLSFDAATRTFSGTPNEAGTISVKVTASDGSLTVDDTFDIVVGFASVGKTVTITGISNDTGVAGDYITSDSDGLTISATLSAALATGEVLQYSRDNGATWSIVPSTSISNTSVSYADSGLTSTNTIQMRVTNGGGSGQAGTADTQLVTIDASAPTQTVTITDILDNEGDVTGTVSTGGITDDTSLNLKGTVNAPLASDETVAIYDGSNFLGNAIVSGNNWTFADPRTLANAQAVSYTAKVVDTADNAGTASNTYTATVNTSVPTININSIAGNAVTDVASGLNGTFDAAERGTAPATVATKPVISGTSSNLDGQTITVTLNGTNIQATVATGGAWSVALTDAQAIALNHGNTYDVFVAGKSRGGKVATDINNGMVVDIAGPEIPTVLNNYSSTLTPTLTGSAMKVDPNNTSSSLALGIGDRLGVTVGGATYIGTIGSLPPGMAYDAATKQWSVNTATAIPTSGTLTLATGNTYNVGVTVEAGSVTKTDVSTGELRINTVNPTITLNEISDNYINAAEAGQSLTITGVTNAEVGSTVSLAGFGVTPAPTANVLAGTGGNNTFSFTLTAAQVTAYATVTNAGSTDFTASVVNKFGLSGSDAENVIIDVSTPTFATTGTDVATAQNENIATTVVVYDANATDTGGAVSYSLSGTDAGAFNINASTGEVTFKASPNYESKTSYSFTVAATDLAGNTTSKPVTLAINNVDEAAPLISSGATATVAENTAATAVVYTATATDTDYAPGALSISYSLTGTDASLLTINSSTGAVTLNAASNYEAKTSYSFNVVATDAKGNAGSQAVTLNVTNVDEVAPTFTSAITATAVNENIAANTAVYTAAATDTDFNSPATASSVTYSLKAATGDVSKFTIIGSTGVVTLTESPNYEAKNSYAFTVVATDAAGNAREQAVTLGVNNLNEAPTGTNAAFTVLEDGSKTFAAADFGFADTSDSPANTLSAVIITTLPTAGTLKLNGTDVTLNQSIAVANLGNLVFAPAANANGNAYATIGFKVQDNGGTANGGADTSTSANTLTFNVTAVNDQPTAPANISSTASAEDQGAPSGASFGQTIASLGGINGASLDVEGAAVGLAFVAPITSTSGTAWYSIDGGTTWNNLTTALATASETNAFVLASTARVYFQGNLNANGTLGTATVRTWDGTDGATSGAYKNISALEGATGAYSATTAALGFGVTAVNDAPVNTVPGAQSTTTATAKVISGLSIVDVDSFVADIMSITLAVDHGTINVATTGTNITLGTNGTGSVTLSGTKVNLNALLASANAVTYTSAGGYVGSDTLTMTTSDNGNTGSGGILTDQDTVAITVASPDSIAPTLLSSSPADNGTVAYANVANDLTLTFSEAVQKGTGLIELYNASNTLVESFDVATSTKVTGWNGSTLTINPTADLAAGTGYYVKVATTAIKDLANNAYAGITDATTLNFTVSAGAGSVIDLGASGKLIKPVQVEGKWYYFWDMSGDGTTASTGSLNGGLDVATHDVLDSIFKYDINGNLNPAAGTNTNSVYRYATLNGVQVALPTLNGDITSGYVNDAGQTGTAATVGGTSLRYDEWLAIWDTQNGTGTGTSTAGTPTGWLSNSYWTATEVTPGGVHIPLNSANGSTYVNSQSVTITEDGSYNYVALQVVAANAAPVLADTVLTLTGVSAGAAAPVNGSTTGSDLVSSLVGGISDTDVGATKGIAITGVHTGGTLYYSTNGGTTWTAASGLSNTNALLLAADTDSRVYYKANGTTGTISDAITFRAWDMTANITEGVYTDTTPRGGKAQFSTATDTVSVVSTVNAGDTVIDLGASGKLIKPVQVEGKWYYYWDRSGDGTSASTGTLNGGVDTVTHDTLDSIFKYDINGNLNPNVGTNTNDVYRYATINGVQLALPTVNGNLTTVPYDGTFQYLNGTTYSDAGATSNGTNSSVYDDFAAIWDAYNGSVTGNGGGSGLNGLPVGWAANAYWTASFRSADGSHSYLWLTTGYTMSNVTGASESAPIQAALQVVAANAAPVLDAAQSPTLTSVSAGAAAPVNGNTTAGDLVSTLVGGITDADGAGVAKGIAITGVRAGATLYYTTNGGTTWLTATGVSETNALLLAADSNTRVFYGTSTAGTGTDAITFRAWDMTANITEGVYTDTTPRGGKAQFSTASDTVSISVTDPLQAAACAAVIYEGGHLSDGTGTKTYFSNASFANATIKFYVGSTLLETATLSSLGSYYQTTYMPVVAGSVIHAEVVQNGVTYVIGGGLKLLSVSPWSLSSYTYATPLVLDLNGDGVQTTDAAHGVLFDLSNSGTPQQTSWVDKHDGFLAMDLNGDGKINSGAELFGSSTKLADGSVASNGWAALAAMDTNGDGKVDAQDAGFEKLRVWVDANGDGVTEAGELKTLSEAGVASINLNHDNSVTYQNGNALQGVSSFTTTSGETHEMVDALLQMTPLSVMTLNSGESLDLSNVSNLSLVTGVNMSADTAANIVKLSLADVLSVATDASIANGVHKLTLTGDANDTVELDLSQWANTGTTVTEGDHTYAVYNASSAAAAQLLIDQHMVLANHG